MAKNEGASTGKSGGKEDKPSKSERRKARQKDKRQERKASRRDASGKKIPKKYRSPLYNSAMPLGGKDLYKAAKSLAGEEFRRPIRELGRDIKQSTRQGKALMGNVEGYYDEVGAEGVKGLARAQASQASLSDQLAKIGKGAQQTIEGAQKAAEGVQQADANLRGGNQGDAAYQLAKEYAAGKSSVAGDSAIGEIHGAQQGSNWTSYQDALNQTTRMKGGEVLGRLANQIANQTYELRGERNDLRQEKAKVLAARILELRQQNFENELAKSSQRLEAAALDQEGNLAQLGLQQDSAELAAEMEESDKDRRAANRRNREDNETSADNNRRNNANDGDGGKTDSQKDDAANAKDAARKAQAAFKKSKGRNPTARELTDLLRYPPEGAPYSAFDIRVARKAAKQVSKGGGKNGGGGGKITGKGDARAGDAKPGLGFS